MRDRISSRETVLRILFIILSVVWMGVLFYLSSLAPDFKLPFVSTNCFLLNDNVTPKIFHFINFGILSLLYLCGMKKGIRLSDAKLRVFILSLLVSVFYAAVDEYHQSFVPGRHPLVTDVFIDASGAFTFLFAIFFLRRRTSSQNVCASGGEEW